MGRQTIRVIISMIIILNTTQALADLKLSCKTTNYSISGYSEDWGKSWIPVEHDVVVSEDKVYSTTTGKDGKVTLETDSKIEFVFFTDGRQDAAKVKGVYFKTNGKLMTRIEPSGGYRASGPIWGLCSEERMESQSASVSSSAAAGEERSWRNVRRSSSTDLFVDDSASHIKIKSSNKWYYKLYERFSDKPYTDIRIGFYTTNEKVKIKKYDYKIVKPTKVSISREGNAKVFIFATPEAQQLLSTEHRYIHFLVTDYEKGMWFGTRTTSVGD